MGVNIGGTAAFGYGVCAAVLCLRHLTFHSHLCYEEIMTLKYILPICLSLTVTPLTFAQSSNTVKPPKPATLEAPTAAPQKAPPKAKPAQKTAPKDLDSFFKEGERQAKEGPTCEKKPEPVA